jgi:FkbM family methyltransferase
MNVVQHSLRKCRQVLGYASLKDRVPAPLLIREMAWRYWMNGEREIRLLRQLIKPGSNSVDVGAASGLYSYHMSRFSRFVFAFEPNPQWTRWLFRAVPRNVSVFDVALSNNSGTAVLSIPPPSLQSLEGDLTLRCLEAASIEKQFEGVPCDRLIVPIRRLDDYKLQNVSFIKIDVEGHEIPVLEGAEGTLSECRPTLLVEIDYEHIRKDIREEFAKIEAKHYEGWFYLDGKLRRLGEFNARHHQPRVAFDSQPASFVNNFIFITSETAKA